MLRIGKHVNCYRNIIARINKKSEDREYNDVIKSLSDLSNAIYFLLDHILLINRMNVVKMDSNFVNRIDFYSNIAWGAECFFNLIYDLVDYYHIVINLKNFKSDLKKIENKESVEFKNLIEKANTLKYEEFRKVIDILRCVFDIPVNIYLLS